MKKNLFLSFLFFVLGFFAHAIFFPEVLSNGLADVPEIPIVNVKPTQTADQNAGFMTRIEYDGEQFSRHNITIEVGSYFILTNISKDKLMWLNSNNPLLATVRGYGESETIRVRMDERGKFVIVDKNNPQEKLVITVK